VSQVTQTELAVIVVREITPILLNVHFIGIQRDQIDFMIRVLFDQIRQKGQRLVAEIIHFRRLILEQNKNTIISFQQPVAGVLDLHPLAERP